MSLEYVIVAQIREMLSENHNDRSRGQVLENVDDNRAELLRQAQEFTAEQKPLLKALEIL